MEFGTDTTMNTGSSHSAMTAITAIRDISQVIVGAFDLQELLDKVVATLRELSRADACSIWLIDPDGKVRIKAAAGFHERLLATFPAYLEAVRAGRLEAYCRGEPIPAEYDLGEGLSGQIAKSGKPVRTTGEKPHWDVHQQWRGKYDQALWPEEAESGCKSFFGAPLKVQERTTGIIKMENKRETDGRFAIAFSAHAFPPISGLSIKSKGAILCNA